MVNAQFFLNQNYPKEERKKVTDLDISDRNLESHLDLRDFVNLKTLDCSKNQLSSIDLSNCKNLQSISCRNNRLSNIDFLKELPNLDNIIYLDNVEIVGSILLDNLKEWKEAKEIVKEIYIQKINELKSKLGISPEKLEAGREWEKEIKNKKSITKVKEYAKEIEKDIYQKAGEKIPDELDEKKVISKEERIEKLVEIVKNNDIKELDKEGIVDIINEKDKQGNVSLHYAVANGNEEMVKILLEVEGVDLGVLNVRNLSALHIAIKVSSNSKEVDNKKNVNLLLEKGANASIRDLEGNTPLHFAAEENNLEIFKLLVEKEADINAVNENGWTILHSAASGVVNKKEDWNIIELMLEKGVDIDVKTKNGLEVEDIFLKVDYSYLACYEELIEKFLKKHANQELVANKQEVKTI